MKCSGLHCDGCGKGAGLAGAVAVVIIGAALYHAATSPAVEHAVSEALTIAAVTLVCIAGLAGLAGLTWAGLAIRRAVIRRNAARLPVWDGPGPAGLADGPEPVTLVSSRPVREIAPRAALSATVSPARARAARRWGARP